jgi:hypothetical protein
MRTSPDFESGRYGCNREVAMGSCGLYSSLKSQDAACGNPLSAVVADTEGITKCLKSAFQQTAFWFRQRDLFAALSENGSSRVREIGDGNFATDADEVAVGGLRFGEVAARKRQQLTSLSLIIEATSRLRPIQRH